MAHVEIGARAVHAVLITAACWEGCETQGCCQQTMHHHICIPVIVVVVVVDVDVEVDVDVVYLQHSTHTYRRMGEVKWVYIGAARP